MVEINNQRKAFLDMLAWSEGPITDVRNQKSWLWRHCRRRAIYWLPDHPRKLVTLNPKLKSTGAGRYQLLPVGGMPTASSLAWKTSLEKSGRCGIAADIWAWRLLPMIDRGGYPQRGSTVAVTSRIPSGAGGQFEHKADSLIAKFKEAGGTVREIDVWAESPRLSPLWLSASSSACHAAVNHYRDNAITYKAQRDKNARELKLANGANLTRTCRCVSVMLLRSMQNTRRS